MMYKGRCELLDQESDKYKLDVLLLEKKREVVLEGISIWVLRLSSLTLPFEVVSVGVGISLGEG
jgi:hypothetical protein